MYILYIEFKKYILTVSPHRLISCAAPGWDHDANNPRSGRCRCKPAGNAPPLWHQLLRPECVCPRSRGHRWQWLSCHSRRHRARPGQACRSGCTWQPAPGQTAAGGGAGEAEGLHYACLALLLLCCAYNASVSASMAASSSTATTPLWHIYYVWQATCLIESVECVCGRHFVNNNHAAQIFAQSKGFSVFPYSVSRIFLFSSDIYIFIYILISL